MNRDGTEMALADKVKSYRTHDCFQLIAITYKLETTDNNHTRNTGDNEKERQKIELSNLLSSADIPHTVFASCSEP